MTGSTAARWSAFPTLELAYAESQVGWMPFQYERMDGVWHESVGDVDLPEPPSSYLRGRVFGCIFDDLHGLRSRDEVGMEHILFECDFPHSNGSFPDSRRRAWELSSKAGLERAGGLPAGAGQRDRTSTASSVSVSPSDTADVRASRGFRSPERCARIRGPKPESRGSWHGSSHCSWWPASSSSR